MLICVVMAAIVMTFASVNGERIGQYMREEQAYYAVTSAIDETQCVLGKGQLTATSGSHTVPDTCADKGLAEIVGSWAERCIAASGKSGSSSDDGVGPLVVTVGGTYQTSQGSASLPEVELTFTMDNYSITAVARQAADSTGARDYNYPLEETYLGTSKVNSENVTEYSWSKEVS